MGGIVSTGKSNEDLINNLVQVDYIKTSAAEIAFRAVDRAEYFLPENRGNAYQDAAWKCGHLHISAPCIYSEVIEGLCLEPGLSFLNLGSGTGYLSTVVGIILGTSGINHGIEFHEDVVQYAYKKLEDFKKYSGAIDEFDFCEPVFARANCLCLTENRLYDRVYCGAACPVEYEQHLKNLIKIGGILVVPISENLMQYKRISETQWESKSLLPVSFANLLRADETSQDLSKLFDIQPQSLQALSRIVIRDILRRNIQKELPPVKRRPSVKEPSFREAFENRKLIKRYIVPVLDDSSDDDLPDGGWWELNRSNNLLGHLFETLKYRDRGNCPHYESTTRRNRTQAGAGSSVQSDDCRRPAHSRSRRGNQSSSSIDEAESDGGVVLDVNSERVGREIDEVMNDNANATSSSMLANDGSACSSISYQDHRGPSNSNCTGWAESSESEATSSNQSRSTYERKKFDSGIGDENEILEVSDNETNEPRCRNPIIAHSSDYMSVSDEEPCRSAKRSSRQGGSRCVKWRRVSSEHNMSTDSESDDDQSNAEYRMYKSRYSIPMKKKIQELPLPQVLKKYVNCNRDF